MSVPGPATVRLRAHAKLTLSLRVLGRRPDGYHELEAFAVSLERPADLVEVTVRDASPGEERRCVLELAGETGDVPRGEDNLAVRAALTLLDRAPSRTAATLRLTKAIPAGAGLGGGSADAAAVLRGVATLLRGGSDLAHVDLRWAAEQLGSDVPFCLTGGAAWMRGRGEVVGPVEVGRPAEVGRSAEVGSGPWVVVAVPPLHVSTPAVYAAWDELGGPTSARTVPLPEGFGLPVTELVNDLEPAAFAVEPALEAFRDRLARAAKRPVSLAGSGAAWFVPVGDEQAARELAAAVGSSLGPTVRVVATPLAARGVTSVADERRG